MRKIINNIKNNAVLYISGILAIASCFAVTPDKQYIGYINFRVLSILFCLMLIVAALGHAGTFDVLTNKLLSKVKSYRGISLLMSVLAFFMSMFLTNDVSLVTLIPFAILVLAPFGEDRKFMFTLIIMTVAANLGSMLTPIGNPQNLYLYDTYKVPLTDFLLLMLPYSALALIVIIAMTFLLIRGSNKLPDAQKSDVKKLPAVKIAIYAALFILNILTVIGYVHFLISLAVTAAALAVMDRKSFLKADYNLLLTFVVFFVLIGNIGRIDMITGALSGLVSKYPVPAAILSSQIISNVPAAMLLSAFTEDGKSLIIGTNLGGLGTIIASMASLITYRFHASYAMTHKTAGQKKENYLLNFTIINIVTLALLFGLYMVLR